VINAAHRHTQDLNFWIITVTFNNNNWCQLHLLCCCFVVLYKHLIHHIPYTPGLEVAFLQYNYLCLFFGVTFFCVIWYTNIRFFCVTEWDCNLCMTCALFVKDKARHVGMYVHVLFFLDDWTITRSYQDEKYGIHRWF